MTRSGGRFEQDSRAGAPSDFVSAYDQDGFVVVKGLLSSEEVGALRDFAHQDKRLFEEGYGRRDSDNQPVKLALWNEPETMPYGLVSRLPRIVDRVEQLLGEAAYHWHTKLVMKEPRGGGAWEWHQDYGYWYGHGCLYPRLVTVWIALDAADRHNGCLQVLRGSHQLGRIDHTTTGDQQGADMERVAEAEKRHKRCYVEAQPGDAVFFQCNLLHRSDQNRADVPRWSLICCYNARSNSPYREIRHPKYQPLEKVSETAIIDWFRRQAGQPNAVAT